MGARSAEQRWPRSRSQGPMTQGLVLGPLTPPMTPPARREVSVTENQRKLSFSNSDLNDPAQLNHMYLECVDQVISGRHPVSRETAIRLAAIQCFVENGPYRERERERTRDRERRGSTEGWERAERRASRGSLKLNITELLPKEYRAVEEKKHEKNINEQYRELLFENEQMAKRKYCDICRSLPTYGMTFFVVKEPEGNRLVTRLFGVNKECVMSVDARTKVVRKTWPMEQLRRWAASPITFNIDFGDYKDGYYSVQTLEGEKIKRLIAEFVDIIILKKQLVDPHGLEGDEGVIMIEDMIAPAQALPIPFAQFSFEGTRSPEPMDIDAKPRPPRTMAPLQNLPLSPPFDVELMDQVWPEPIGPQSPQSPFVPLENLPPLKGPFEPRRQGTFPSVFEYPRPLPQPQQSVPPPQQPFVPEPFSLPPPPTTQTQFSSVMISSLPPGPLPPDHSGHPHQQLTTGTTTTTVSSASSAVLTTREIHYEIVYKDGMASRSFHHQYTSNRDLRVLTSAIDQNLIHVRKTTEVLGQPISQVQLGPEEREWAMHVGEETIRRKMLMLIACSAQIIEWTSKDLVRRERQTADAVATISASLCDLAVCVWELCALVPAENVPALLQLTRSLCDGYSVFIDKLNPENPAKRSSFLSSASLVGEIAFALLNALNEDESEAEEDQQFYNALNASIQEVATSTANLVLQAKSVPVGVEPEEAVLVSATEVAVTTTELIALTRVLASIIAHPACQERISVAADKVDQAIRALLAARAYYVPSAGNYVEFGEADQMRRSVEVAENALRQLVAQIRQ